MLVTRWVSRAHSDCLTFVIDGTAFSETPPTSLVTSGAGTYQWMSPEVLGHQRYSFANDAYSFGIVLWETSSRVGPSPPHASNQQL